MIRLINDWTTIEVKERSQALFRAMPLDEKSIQKTSVASSRIDRVKRDESVLELKR